MTTLTASNALRLTSIRSRAEIESVTGNGYYRTITDLVHQDSLLTQRRQTRRRPSDGTRPETEDRPAPLGEAVPVDEVGSDDPRTAVEPIHPPCGDSKNAAI